MKRKVWFRSRVCLKTADHRRTPQTTAECGADHLRNARKAADHPKTVRKTAGHTAEHGVAGSKTAEQHCMCIFRYTLATIPSRRQPSSVLAYRQELIYLSMLFCLCCWVSGLASVS